LEDKDEWTKGVTARALGSLDARDAIPKIRELLKSDDSVIKWCAIDHSDTWAIKNQFPG